ncbi:MAG: hypothetical protein R3A46_02050 [Thermomicrobiales bacterium]
MSPRQARERLEDFENFDDDWEEGEAFQPIRRRERRTQEPDSRRDGKRKRERRREPPVHKREEP